MSWLLIIFMYGNAPNINVLEFNSEEKCKAVLSQMKKEFNTLLYDHMNGICVLKG